MLTLLASLIAAVVASPAAPIQSPPPPSPLTEIGRVQALPVCSALLVHANSAISQTLDNDQQLAIAINRLQTTDLDTTNVITLRNGMADLSTLAGRLRTGAAAGTGEVKRLRVMAAATTEPSRKAELKAFADALGGALARQRKAGVDLDRMLVIIDGRRAVQEVNSQDLVDQRAAIADPGMGPRNALPAGGIMRSAVAPAQSQAVNPMLRGVADEFAERSAAIRSDEGVAADHALGATTGC